MEDIVRLPQMSFGESVKTVLSKLTDFKVLNYGGFGFFMPL